MCIRDREGDLVLPHDVLKGKSVGILSQKLGEKTGFQIGPVVPEEQDDHRVLLLGEIADQLLQRLV